MALAAAFALLLAPEAAWSQTEIKLVSNAGQTDSATHGTFGQDHSQAFTTGSNPNGYRLTAVEVELSYTVGETVPSPIVRLQEADEDTVTDGASWNVPSPFSSGTARFTPEGVNVEDGFLLDPNTTYRFFLSILGFEANANVNILTTASDAEDSGAQAGWSIANERLTRPAADTTWSTGTHDALQIAFYGHAVSPPQPQPQPQPTNSPPTVSASCEPCEVPPGGEVRLAATANDSDGRITGYQWTAAAGTFDTRTEAEVVWTAPERAGKFIVRVMVRDDGGATASAQATITVAKGVPAVPAAGLAILAFLLIGGERRLRRRFERSVRGQPFQP